MKAFITAAGLGTRLGQLTKNQPKVMLEVGGKKILERTLGQLAAAGVNDLVINTHYFSTALTDYFGDGRKWAIKISYSYEPEILGTAGGLKKCQAYFINQKEFLVVYGDNVYDLDFAKIINQPLKSRCLLVLFDRRYNPNSGAAGGLVEARAGLITGFYEGTTRPDLDYVNGGIYKCSPTIFNAIPAGNFYDFGKDVFPAMLKNHEPLQAYVLAPNEALFGIDTPEYLEKANQYFKL